MKRDWKPGDVAMVNNCTQPDEPWKVALCIASAVPGVSETRWRIDAGEVWGSVSEARPLVVIDPEDTETVDAHWRMAGQSLGSYRTALREYANPTPPKPEEPTGLGAVVEDAEGNLWVRTDRAAPWSPIRGIGGDRAIRRLWSELDVVRVLSEGVQP